MKMRNLFIAVLAVSFLAACGSNSTGETVVTTSTSTTTTTTTTASTDSAFATAKAAVTAMNYKGTYLKNYVTVKGKIINYEDDVTPTYSSNTNDSCSNWICLDFNFSSSFSTTSDATKLNEVTFTAASSDVTTLVSYAFTNNRFADSYFSGYNTNLGTTSKTATQSGTQSYKVTHTATATDGTILTYTAFIDLSRPAKANPVTEYFTISEANSWGQAQVVKNTQKYKEFYYQISY